MRPLKIPRVGWVIAPTLLLMSACISPAVLQANRECITVGHPGGVSACTKIIQSGEFSGRDLAITYSNRGMHYNENKQYREAIADFDQAIGLDQQYAIAHNNRGNSYAELKEFNRAIPDFDAAIRFNPDFAVAYENRAWAYYNMGEAKRGLPDINRAMQLHTPTAFTWHHKGHILKALGQQQEAIDALRTALTLNPNQELRERSVKSLKELGVEP